MNFFAENLKTLRKEAGLLQRELAEKLDLTKNAISGWEVGRNQPDYDTLLRICDVFDVSADEILRTKL